MVVYLKCRGFNLICEVHSIGPQNHIPKKQKTQESNCQGACGFIIFKRGFKLLIWIQSMRDQATISIQNQANKRTKNSNSLSWCWFFLFKDNLYEDNTKRSCPSDGMENGQRNVELHPCNHEPMKTKKYISKCKDSELFGVSKIHLIPIILADEVRTDTQHESPEHSSFKWTDIVIIGVNIT